MEFYILNALKMYRICIKALYKKHLRLQVFLIFSGFFRIKFLPISQAASSLFSTVTTQSQAPSNTEHFWTHEEARHVDSSISNCYKSWDQKWGLKAQMLGHAY